MGRGFQVDRLAAVERDAGRPEWIPLRRRFGVASFGINAWSATGPDEPLIPEHDEVGTGHEELYLVLAGDATFTVGGEEIEASTGTVVFVEDPAVRRGARAGAGGATILTAGGKPGEPFRISPWETGAEVGALFDRGDYAGVKHRLEPHVRANPGDAGSLYNLACAEALLGETDAALEHLRRSVELDGAFAAAARDDDDLAALQGDPRFEAAVRA